MAQPPIPRGREFNLILMLNGTGIVFRWNVRDMQVPDALLYSFEFRWRDYLPRLWWEFRWVEWHGHSSLEYSHGRKGKQKFGWKISGPLVKFTAEHL